MLRNIFLKTLRDNRGAMLIWGLGLGLIVIIGISQYPALLGGPEGQRAQMAAEMTKLLQAYSFMLGEIVPITTLGGFITVRLVTQIPVILGLWALVAGVGLIRGEEEPGTLDVLLTTPHSRLAVFAQKGAALAVALAGAIVLLMAAMQAGALLINDSLPPAALATTALNIFTIVFFWAAVALLVGQLVTTRRGGWGVVGAALIGTNILNNLLEGIEPLKNWAWLMPFHYYSLSKPLVPGRPFEWGAWLALAGATGVVLALGAWLFVHRDLGAAFRLWPARRGAAPAATGGAVLLLGSVFAKSGRDLLLPTLGWSLALSLYALIIISTADVALQPIRDVVQNLPWLAQLAGDMTSNEAYLSLGIFTQLPLLLAFFGLTQVWGWANDEEEGRLELLAAQPLPRLQILLARYLAATLSVLVILATLGAAIFGSAAAANLALDSARVGGGLVAAVPLPLAILAAGLALATWLARPGLAVGITGAGIVVMYFLDALAAIFNWPEAVRTLSVFYLYGRPVVAGVTWSNVVLLTALTLALVAASLVGFQRRDIAK